MNATWDVAGKGEWHDSTITLTDLSTGFDQLQYGTMTVEKPRLILDKPVVWGRDAQHPPSAALCHWTPGKRCSLAAVCYRHQP